MSGGSLPENGCTHCAGCHTGRRPYLASATAGSRGWLLVEHPGPWGGEIETTPLPAPVAGAIASARRHNVRPQLIRAPRRRRATPPLRVYVGFSGSGGSGGSGGGGSWLEARELKDPGE